MNVQGPPIHYPSCHESTNEVYRTRPSVSEASPARPANYPPAYATEGGSPVYNEAHAATETGEEDTTKPKSKRKIFIRLSTAIFITLIIALIVAGVVGRIDLLETQKAEDNSMGSERTSPEKTTLVFKSTAAAQAAMMDPSSIMATIMPTTASQSTPSHTSHSAPTSITTNTMPETSLPRGGSFFEPVADDAETLGVTMFTFRDCLLSKAPYKGEFDETNYRCTLACDSVDLEGDLAGEVVVDDWEWDCG